MAHTPEDFADMVAMTIKSVVAPLVQRLAAVEAKSATTQEVRDRVVVLETKVGLPPVSDPALVEIRDRLKALELSQSAPRTDDAGVAEIRDRLGALEAKSGMVPPPDLELRDKLVALETRVSIPDTSAVHLSERLALVEGRVQDDALAKELGTFRERVAVLETRAPVPGPAGQNGKDGADGMGWDDLAVQHDGERTFTVKLMRGERVKDAGTFTVPVDIYRGVYAEGSTYERGDGVTWGGSEWHCNEATSAKPGEGSKAWTLKVKRGRDGRDGRDAATVPVVRVN